MSHLPTPPRAALHSVGCKLNQYEAELLRQALQDRGYLIVDFAAPAEVYVLYSCTVTSRTDRECRRLLRGCRARNPQALVVAAGCYAEVAGEELSRQGLADLVVGTRDRVDLAALLAGRVGGAALAPAVPPAEGPPLLREFGGHTRAFVKVQEGCSGGCAFCLISRARGPERSVPRAQVLDQVRLLARRHPEIVLVGTHLGRYGRDLPGETDLAGLVEALCALPELGRLRLSSLEPMEVSAPLAELVVSGGHCLPPDPSRPGQGKVCRHLHLPLQSGCDRVLERMGRPYRAQQYADLVADLTSRQPGLGLGADVMVGFPGETEADFAETLHFVESLPLAYLHVFTYSSRPGTRAAEMPDQVPPPLRKERNHLLRDLSERQRAAFAATQVGQALEVVVERPEPGRVCALSDNYLEVALPPTAAAPGALLRALPTAAEGGTLRGVALAAPPSDGALVGDAG